MKTVITEKQKEQFNKMLNALRTIAKEYETSDELRKNSEKKYGLDFEETIEMVYDNVQLLADNACKNVRPLK